MIDIQSAFDAAEEDFLKFNRVVDKLHTRPDICAFLLVDKLCPGEDDMVSHAQHDEIFLTVDPDALALVATEADILTLVRCGVRYSEDSLCMFV